MPTVTALSTIKTVCKQRASISKEIRFGNPNMNTATDKFKRTLKSVSGDDIFKNAPYLKELEVKLELDGVCNSACL